MINFEQILSEGITINTSGTTGTPKHIFQSPVKLRAANLIAVDCQKITSNSSIYTVCSIDHAGGLLAQTLPAYSIGASVTVSTFNAFNFIKTFESHTHTHLTPTHARLIMKTKSFKTADFTGKWITCGSDSVDWDIIEAFVERNAIFMVNWGMTEIGPCAINTVFNTMDEISIYRHQAPSGTTILGDTSYCDTDVRDGRLFVKGDISVYGDDWYDTGDLVQTVNGIMYYTGRQLVA